MKKCLLLFGLVLLTYTAQSQAVDSLKQGLKRAQEVAEGYVAGTVLNASTDEALSNVNIVNLNNVKGATTDQEGRFTIKAQVDDTLFITYLGFKSLQVRVSNDWIAFGNVKVKMTEVGIALDEVIVQEIQLTGYLEIDAKAVPIYNNSRYSISGLSQGYEGGKSQPSAVTKALSAIFNPADFLYNLFGKKPAQMRKLRKMKEDDQVRNLLEKKFDRETLAVLLQVERVDIDEILRNCNYSENFITKANDLQILDAISECYEEYRILNKND